MLGTPSSDLEREKIYRSAPPSIRAFTFSEQNSDPARPPSGGVFFNTVDSAEWVMVGIDRGPSKSCNYLSGLVCRGGGGRPRAQGGPGGGPLPLTPHERRRWGIGQVFVGSEARHRVQCLG